MAILKQSGGAAASNAAGVVGVAGVRKNNGNNVQAGASRLATAAAAAAAAADVRVSNASSFFISFFHVTKTPHLMAVQGTGKGQQSTAAQAAPQQRTAPSDNVTAAAPKTVHVGLVVPT